RYLIIGIETVTGRQVPSSGVCNNPFLRRSLHMQSRIDFRKVSPAAIKTMYDMKSYLARSSIERPLLLLVKMRASQINGCAYCIDMHSKDARNEGETEQRLYALDAWRETPFFSERERAALAWTESLTLIARTRAPDEDYS